MGLSSGEWDRLGSPVCCMIFPLLYSLGLGLGVQCPRCEMKTLSVNALDSEPVNSYREVLAKKVLAMLGAPPPRRDLELVDYSVNWLLNSAANSESMVGHAGLGELEEGRGPVQWYRFGVRCTLR